MYTIYYVLICHISYYCTCRLYVSQRQLYIHFQHVMHVENGNKAFVIKKRKLFIVIIYRNINLNKNIKTVYTEFCKDQNYPIIHRLHYCILCRCLRYTY